MRTSSFREKTPSETREDSHNGNAHVRDFSGLYHRAAASRKKRKHPRRETGGANVGGNVINGERSNGSSLQDHHSKMSIKNLLGFKDSVGPTPSKPTLEERRKKCADAVKLLIIDDNEATVNFFVKELIDKRNTTWATYYPTVLANALTNSNVSNAGGGKGTEEYLLAENSELLKCVTVKTTNNGRDGLNYLRNEAFDVVFINLNVAMIYNDGTKAKEIHFVVGPRSTTPTPSERRQSFRSDITGNPAETTKGDEDISNSNTPSQSQAQSNSNSNSNANTPSRTRPGSGRLVGGDLSGGVMTLKKFREYLECEKQSVGNSLANAGSVSNKNTNVSVKNVNKLQAAGATEKFTDSMGEELSVSFAISQRQQSAAGMEVPGKSSKNSKAWLNNMSQSNPRNINYTRSEVGSGTHVLTSSVSMRGSSTSVYTPNMSKEFSIDGSMSDHEQSDNDGDDDEHDDDEFTNEHALIVGMGEDCSDQQISAARQQNMHYFCEKPVELVDLYSILGAVDFARRFDESQEEDEASEAEAEGNSLMLTDSFNRNGLDVVGGARSSSPGPCNNQNTARRAPSNSPPPGMNSPMSLSTVSDQLSPVYDSNMNEFSLGSSGNHRGVDDTLKSVRSSTSIVLEDASYSATGASCTCTSALTMIKMTNSLNDSTDEQLEAVEAAAVKNAGKTRRKSKSAPKEKYNPRSAFAEDGEFAEG